MQLNWFTFDELGAYQLYEMLQLRSDIFVIEQKSLFRDIDGLDSGCLHLLAYQEDELIGYLRLIPRSNENSVEVSRVAIRKTARGRSLGQVLMVEAIECAQSKFAKSKLFLCGQSALESFYQGFGFTRASEDYFDEGILHCRMNLTN